MKLLDAIFYNRGRGPSDGNNYWRRFTLAHYVYIGVMLVMTGAGVGLAATAAEFGWDGTVFSRPLPLLLNVLPSLMLLVLFYFITGRSWAAFLISAALSYVQVAVVSGRTAELAPWLALAFLGGVAFTFFLMPGTLRGFPARIIGVLAAMAVCAALLFTLYANDGLFTPAAEEKLAGALYRFVFAAMRRIV